MTWRALCVWLLLPAAAMAQRGAPRSRIDASHVPVPASAPGMEATELLARKLAEAEMPGYLQQLLRAQGGMDAASAQKLLQSPFAAQILQRLADGDPALMKLVEQYAAGRPELKGLTPDKIKELLQQRAGELIRPGAHTDQDGRLAQLLQSPPSAAERERLARQAYTERIHDALRDLKLDGVMDQLRDSPSFQNWMQSLSQTGSQGNPGPLTLGDTMQLFGGLDNFVRMIRPYLPRDLPSLRDLNLSPPSSPNVNIPSFGISQFSLPWLDSMGAHWPTVVVLLALTVIALAGLLRYYRSAAAPIAVTHQLGPWPVDPRRISTRQEVIAAFEYLALLKCGQDAAHWHHRAVAHDLGRDMQLRDDAESAAAIYEQARYAAPDQPGLWEQARTFLSRLAGGAT